MYNDIVVSVICITYNQEQYVNKCLDGLVMQKTNFLFEVIIHDDASTDKTQSIIAEYQKKYPNIIKPIYQRENQYSKGVKIVKSFMLPICKGKYIAFCEGDDFWTDEYKLQKQVDALEKHPECDICLHKVRAVTADLSEEKHTYPPFELKTGVLPQAEFLKLACEGYNFQTTSHFLRTDKYKNYLYNKPKFAEDCPIGDVPLLMYFASAGDAYYIDEEMSKYRLVSKGSWNEKHNKSAEFRVRHYRELVKMVEEFEEYTDYKYPNCYSDLYRRWYKMLWVHRDFKELFNKHYKEFFKQESFKDKMYIRASVYCPFIAKLYDKIKGNKVEN